MKHFNKARLKLNPGYDDIRRNKSEKNYSNQMKSEREGERISTALLYVMGFKITSGKHLVIINTIK